MRPVRALPLHMFWLPNIDFPLYPNPYKPKLGSLAHSDSQNHNHILHSFFPSIPNFSNSTVTRRKSDTEAMTNLPHTGNLNAMTNLPHEDFLIIKAADGGDLDFFKKLEENIGDREVFRQRCEMGRSFGAKNALHFAAAKGKTDLCIFLIDNVRMNVDVTDDMGTTPLMFAIVNEHVELVKDLILNGSNVNACTIHGATPLDCAIQKGNWEIIRHLISIGANADSVVLRAAEYGKLDFLRDLGLKYRSEEQFHHVCSRAKDSNGKSALHLAVEKGWIEMCEFFIEKLIFDIDIKDKNGNSPLILAVKTGSYNIAQFLITKGANTQLCNSKGLTSLHVAARIGNKELVHLLLQQGANHGLETQNSEHPIVEAIKCGSLECIKLFLEVGVDLNSFSDGRKSPLGLAAEQGDPNIIKCLLDYNADPNAISMGLKPLQLAAMKSKLEAVEVLFLRTNRIPFIKDWTVVGIMGFYAHIELMAGNCPLNQPVTEFVNPFLNEQGLDHRSFMAGFYEGIRTERRSNQPGSSVPPMPIPIPIPGQIDTADLMLMDDANF